MGNRKKNISDLSWLLLKLFILAGTFYYLYQTIIGEGQKPETWFLALLRTLQNGQGVFIFLALGLITINWGLEARKWQKLAAKVEPLNFWQAYRAVLVGICLGFITPNRMGDYAGRIMELQSQQRLEALGAIFLGRFCQLIITVATGSVGIFYFLASFLNPGFGILAGVATTLLLINGGIFLLLFRPGILLTAAAAIPILNRFMQYVNIIATYSVAEIRHLLWLSFWRYSVFLGQFMLLLYAFGVQVPWYQMALGVSGTFLLKSVVPSVSALADLGMRELSAIYFFSLLGQSSFLVMSASLSLWFINIGIPSLVGLLFIWRLKWKIKTKKKSKINSLVLQEEERY
ncbi:MAG: lysylphosphatidylglycerol synthase transmembrane domain-containing protein [Adhaeribacter sp.]